MTGMNIPDDEVTVRGTVRSRGVDAAEVELQTVDHGIPNSRAGRTTTGLATVQWSLPEGSSR